MPKFSKTCNNPFHSEWSDGLEGSKIIILKAYGLGELAGALAKFSAHENQIDMTKKITQLCTNCIRLCLKKRKFTRHLSTQLSTDMIERKVRLNYCCFQKVNKSRIGKCT